MVPVFVSKCTGRMFHETTGLQNKVNRWYDPGVGRWISEDPIEFGASRQTVRATHFLTLVEVKYGNSDIPRLCRGQY